MPTIYRQTITDTLTFTGTPTHNQHIITLKDSFAFSQMDNDVVLDYTIIDRVAYNQYARWSLSTSRTIKQGFAFRDGTRRSKIGDVYQNFTFTQTVIPDKRWVQLSHDLTFTEQVFGRRVKTGFNRLRFVETLNYALQRNPALVDTLNFDGSASIYRDGTSTLASNQLASTFVTFVCGNLSARLRPPEFGNSDSLTMRRVQRESRGKDLIIYRDPQWSYSEVFELQFTYILADDAARFKQFVQATFGQPVQFTDHESQVWLGLILNEDFNIETAGRFNNTFSVKFEVIGS